jgi:hypothetical protein
MTSAAPADPVAPPAAAPVLAKPVALLLLHRLIRSPLLLLLRFWLNRSPLQCLPQILDGSMALSVVDPPLMILLHLVKRLAILFMVLYHRSPWSSCWGSTALQSPSSPRLPMSGTASPPLALLRITRLHSGNIQPVSYKNYTIDQLVASPILGNYRSALADPSW